MQIQLKRGDVSVLLGGRFGAKDASRLREAIDALAPGARLTVDFSAVQESQDAALATLAAFVKGLPDRSVALRGLTLHQSRLLRYLGLDRGADA